MSKPIPKTMACCHCEGSGLLGEAGGNCLDCHGTGERCTVCQRATAECDCPDRYFAGKFDKPEAAA